MGVLELVNTITVINGYINKMQACFSCKKCNSIWKPTMLIKSSDMLSVALSISPMRSSFSGSPMGHQLHLSLSGLFVASFETKSSVENVLDDCKDKHRSPPLI